MSGVVTKGKLCKEPKPSGNVGVLLLNLVGPDKAEDVRGFLYNLFVDPDIIRLPPCMTWLQKPLAYFIARGRAPKSAEGYARIGGGSPIVKYTQAQSDLLMQALSDRGVDAKCYFAMRYWKPYSDEALAKMKDDNITNIVVLPLYPQYSISTTGSSLKAIKEIFDKAPTTWRTEKKHTVVPFWYMRPGYIRTMARLILKELATYSATELTKGVHVLFSAHGVPQKYILIGDPYQRHMCECVNLISQEVTRLLAQEVKKPTVLSRDQAKALRQAHQPLSLVPNSDPTTSSPVGNLWPTIVTVTNSVPRLGEWQLDGLGSQSKAESIYFHLSFQSRVGPVKWLKPYTDDVIAQLGKSGVKNLVVIPVSFVSEHIETLEEIDIEYQELARENGIEGWRRVQALNTDAAFIEDMADAVVEALHADPMSIEKALEPKYFPLSNRGTFI